MGPGQSLPSMPVTKRRRSSLHQVRAGRPAAGAAGQEEGLSFLGLHFTPGFLPGHADDAKPISEPEKETRELGKSLGIWLLLNLGVGTLAGTACFWKIHKL